MSDSVTIRAKQDTLGDFRHSLAPCLFLGWVDVMKVHRARLKHIAAILAGLGLKFLYALNLP